MNDPLQQATVLVLNRNWQAVNTTTPAMAFCQMATGAATALDIHGPDDMVPVRWEDWLRLPVRPQDRSAGTSRGPVRLPTVLVLARYARVPKRRPRLTAAALRARDGNRCQYTGRLLRREEASIDHVLPRSRGGRTSWDNCVLACREVNRRKSNRTPAEAGLRLLRFPFEPKHQGISNHHKVADWELFLRRA